MAIQGCGGGGGGASSSPGGVVLSGTAAKGPISGGTVKVFEIISSASTNPRSNIPRLGGVVAQGTTRSDGSYDISLPAGTTNGGLLVQITGGSYKDEATGATRGVDDQFGADGMRAILSVSDTARQSGKLSVAVTPFTELAYHRSGGKLGNDDIAAANSGVAAAFGLPDIIGTKPSDPTQPFPAGTSDDSKKYTLALAALSQYQNDFSGGKKMAEIETQLETELSGGSLSALTETELKSSSNNFAGSSNNPNSELKDPQVNAEAPAEMQIAPATAVTLSIGASQTISVTVKKNGGSVVADGTLVSFSTTLGSFAPSSAATLTVPTVNGIASATLSSSSVGTASVTVKSGAITKSASISFSDPNAPASLTLSAGASQGVAGFAPVQLSASVVRAAGGSVPDGTPVAFSIVSGSGNLSAASATTSGGVASVNLSSSVAGSVTVAASAGGIVKTLAVPFVAQPTQAIVRVRTVGALPAATLIGGINARVVYSGNKGLSIDPAAVVLSGVSSGSTLVPNTNTAGTVVLGLLNVNGIAVGEFATLRFAIAAGNFPTTADFGISSTGLSVIDTNTTDLTGIGVEIAGVSIQ